MAKIEPISNYKGRVKLSEAIPLSTPFSIFVFPTTYCNFRCAYCAHSLSATEMEKQYGLKEEHMSMEIFEASLSQMKKFDRRLKLLSLTGQGEPMLNKNLPKMVALAKKADVAERIEIISNGSLLNREMADALLEAGLDGLRISVQGVNSNEYREICGVGLDFEEFVANLTYFSSQKKDCELLIKTMDVALQDGEEELFYRIFDPIADRMYIEKCRPVYDGVKMTDGMKGEDMDRYGKRHESRQVCPLCFFQMAIFPNGDVTCCDAIYKPVLLGNVMTSSLAEMWQGEKLRDFQRLHLRGDRQKLSGCQVCCAPDDVAQPEDALDDAANILLTKFEERKER